MGTAGTKEQTELCRAEKSIPSSPVMTSPHQLATFAAGCFWGVQNFFNKQFGRAIISSKVGYTGGQSDSTCYRDVCRGRTGHAEAVQFQFDPSKVTYEELVTYFFRIHDPTTKNRQGNDIGSQYRSAIFYHSDEQWEIAEKVKKNLSSKFKNPIVTEIVEASTFIIAEKEHQDYLARNPGGYCNHRLQW